MKNQDEVLIDGLLENHVGLAFVWEAERFCHDYLLNLLISRLSASLFCMVSGRCCISLKDIKSCTGKTLTMSKNIFIGSYFVQMDISSGRLVSIHPLRRNELDEIQVQAEVCKDNGTLGALFQWLD